MGNEICIRISIIVCTCAFTGTIQLDCLLSADSRRSAGPSTFREQLESAEPVDHSTQAPSVATSATLTPLDGGEGEGSERRSPKKALEHPSMTKGKTVDEVKRQYEEQGAGAQRHSSGINPAPSRAVSAKRLRRSRSPEKSRKHGEGGGAECVQIRATERAIEHGAHRARTCSRGECFGA